VAVGYFGSKPLRRQAPIRFIVQFSYRLLVDPVKSGETEDLLIVTAIEYVNFFGCLGDAAVRRRTHDRKVAGSTLGRGFVKSTRSTQPSIPQW